MYDGIRTDEAANYGVGMTSIVEVEAGVIVSLVGKEPASERSSGTF